MIQTMIDPVLMGAVEQKLVEALLRLQEAFKIMNHLKTINGYETKTLAELTNIHTAEKANACTLEAECEE